MADANQPGLKSASEFEEESRDPTFAVKSDSTEIWLIHYPKQVFDFDGQEIRMDLRDVEGELGAVDTSSGKSYDVVSFTAQEPNARVVLNYAGQKLRHKITRRVSFGHYMEPGEVPKDDIKRLKQLYERSSGTSLTNSGFATPTRSIRPGQSSGRASTHSSGRRSSLSEEKVQPKPSRSSQNSGHSSDRSEEKRAKKKKRVA